MDDELRRIREFLSSGTQPPPYLVIDTSIVADRFHRISTAFGDARICYAVKANPEPQVIRRLVRLGASFDVASPAEIDLCLAEGAAPSALSYGSTIKKARDIAYAHERGVREFAFDSSPELQKIAANAPGAAVCCRLLASNSGAQWPLSRKFGCGPEMAARLLAEAADHGLDPAGLSFHVGSQQLEPKRWDESIRTSAEVFAELRRIAGIKLRTLNVGGGFAVPYTGPVPPVEAYADMIHDSAVRHFGGEIPGLVLEPGRYLAAEAGVLRAEVVLVSRREESDEKRWVYLDVGRFGGLAETEGEAIRYRLATARDGEPDGPVALAGPTCDSVDTLYHDAPYRLPLGLTAGDHVDFLAAGAYTATYSSIGFNGFPPLKVICLDEE